MMTCTIDVVCLKRTQLLLHDSNFITIVTVNDVDDTPLLPCSCTNPSMNPLFFWQTSEKLILK